MDNSFFPYIDIMLIGYRLGHLPVPEQRQAALAAVREANDEFSYLKALNSFGLWHTSKFCVFASHALADIDYYRLKYKGMIGLHADGDEVETFLGNNKVLFLVEPLLTNKQKDSFYDVYWWFVRNHKPVVANGKKGLKIGAYSTEPKDNASTLEQFHELLLNKANARSKAVRERYGQLPIDYIMAILKRAFT